MAEEVAYASVGGDSNKRKYDDSPSPVARRGTGFSGPPDSAAPPPAYNSVPPPMNEIELAKQKAQEIAARLLNNADPLKRARVDNGGGGGGGGYDSSDYGNQKHQGLGLSGPPQMASSGYPGPTKKIEIPNSRVGVIIGKGGETIKYLQLQSGAKIQVTRDMDADPNASTRGVELMGTADQVAKAEQLIIDVLTEADSGGSGIVSRRVNGQPSGAEQFVMKVPNNKVGLVIGKGGETIKSMQARTGARIQVIPLHLPPGDTSQERTVQIDGTSEQIEAAKQLVEEVISENRVRNPSMSGGYPQQGYQAHPPTNWGQSGPPMQQPGYGYAQSGPYSGPSPQYNMNQPSYAGYPPQPTSGGYATGWDQSSAQNQPVSQGGSYDYYNQQQPQQQAQGHDGSGYGYGQATAYSQGQGYSQDGYGGYQASAAQPGYGQTQANPGSGYDQQQQGYNSTYGNVSNPAPDSYGTQGEANQAPAPAPAPGQSYGAGGQPAPGNPNYPPQASTQPSYGAAPPASQGGYGTQTPAGYGSYGASQAQKPPSSQALYAQPQQSPTGTALGGYSQPGYPYSQPPAQPGYAQADTGSQRTASTGYGAASQQGYGAPPYATQTGYGQRQAPAYNTSSYSQPPAYSSDGTTPPPPPQSTPSAAKASPPS